MKKSKENILITRKLSGNSPLWSLSDLGHSIFTHSFLEIVPVDITEIPIAEVYFYYSKNAAIEFVKAAKNLGRDITQSYHATMGSGTAKTLLDLGTQPDFVGSESPNSVARSLYEKYGDKRLCFVRAKQSTQSIQKLWPKEYIDLVIYDTTIIDIELQQSIDTIFATSPKNLHAAMRCCDTDSLTNIICIGPTTLEAAKKLTDINSIMATANNEEAMLDAYLRL